MRAFSGGPAAQFQHHRGKMEKFLLESSEFLMTFAGAVTVITVGVMSILLPILVFRISCKTSRVNRKLDKIISLLGEQVALQKKMGHPDGSGEEDIAISPFSSKKKRNLER